MDVDLDEEITSVHGDLAERLYRIAEEALRNIERHAQASCVRISAAVSRDDVSIEIADDGRGFEADAAHPGHYGLAGMAEQAQMIGGHFVVQTSPGQGARIVIRAPLVHQER
ncbi:MAG: hypothetical protein KDJ40_20130 [Hyphomicrobiales bacterium]|nr:hypothetical protein [Hyphomicrobiales bacterium]